MNILFVFVAVVLCGILGRMGGSSNYNTKFRDMGIPTVCTLLLILLGVHNPVSLFLTFGLMFGALTTYWDFLFGYDNFWFHGFVIGLSLFPIALATGNWLNFCLSVAITTLWMGFWSKFISDDVIEEFGRYAIIPSAVLLTALL